MHQKHGRYYYVHRNKWRPLAKEYHKALLQVAALESPTGDWSNLVAQVYARYEKRFKDGKLAKSTLRMYDSVRARVEYGFSDYTPDTIKASDITQFLDMYEDTPNVANRMLVILKAIFERAVRQGIVDTNPCYGVKRFEESKRDRYLTDAEYRAVHAAANPALKLIMDMCYITGQRISDVLAIEHSHITADGILFQQQKTGKRLLVEMQPELARIVSEAKGLHKVMCRFLFHPKGKAKPYGYSSIWAAYDSARKKAGIEDTTIHDIRAKAATDLDEEGKSAKELLGHSTEAMAQRYIRRLKTDKVTGPNLKRLLDNRR